MVTIRSIRLRLVGGGLRGGFGGIGVLVPR